MLRRIFLKISSIRVMRYDCRDYNGQIQKNTYKNYKIFNKSTYYRIVDEISNYHINLNIHF